MARTPRILALASLGLITLACAHRGPWVDRAGHPVSTSVLQESGTTCPKGDTVLAFHRVPYLLDHAGLSPPQVPVRYEADATLPRAAIDTGFRQGQRQLWVAPGHRPPAVFVVWPDHVERWPRMDFGCS